MVQRGTAPALVNFIARIAAQFNIAVTQKLAVQRHIIYSISPKVAMKGRTKLDLGCCQLDLSIAD